MSDILKKMYVVTMPDGSKWAVPVEVIARNRAEEYKNYFDRDVERSLKEDTLPYFQAYESEIADWAKDNMNWKDVMHVARKVAEPVAPDYQEGWINGEWEVCDDPPRQT